MPMRYLAMLCALCFACNMQLQPTAEPSVPPSCDGSEAYLETLTFNAGLAPGVVPLSTPRVATVAEEIANFREVGVMCLQELWTQESRDAVIRALKLPAEQVYYVDTSGQGDDLSGVNVCRKGQIAPLVSCAKRACDGWPDEEHARCALESCGDEIVDLYMHGGEDCLNCLVSSVGMSIDATATSCTTPDHGISHSYGGQNGVMLVSRWPLKNREAVLLPSSIANREALFATIELEGREPVELACTHVSTWNRLPPSERGPDGAKLFDDWDEEMIAQIEIVSKKLRERAGRRVQVFLGDMNAGPAIGDRIKASAPKVWRRIRALGFESPAAAAAYPFCSTCGGNTLRAPGANDYLIDHVLYRDPVGGSMLRPRCVRRVLDEGHLRYIKDYAGRTVETHISDHYGVGVAFSYK